MDEGVVAVCCHFLIESHTGWPPRTQVTDSPGVCVVEAGQLFGEHLHGFRFEIEGDGEYARGIAEW